MNDTVDPREPKAGGHTPRDPNVEQDQPGWLLPSVLAGGAVVAVLFLVVALAMWALASRSEAQRERQRAEQERDRKVSGESVGVPASPTPATSRSADLVPARS